MKWVKKMDGRDAYWLSHKQVSIEFASRAAADKTVLNSAAKSNKPVTVFWLPPQVVTEQLKY